MTDIADPLVLILILVALLDAAVLYLHLIRSRAQQRTQVREDDEAVLRSLVRVLLLDR